jgi:hypothetical protein
MAFHANQGPRMGLPQMIQSRAQFGLRGAIVPFIAVIFVYIGFNVFNVILATDAINTVLPGSQAPWYALMIARRGDCGDQPTYLHTVQRWLTYVMISVRGADRGGADDSCRPMPQWRSTSLVGVSDSALRCGRLSDQLRGLRVRLLALPAPSHPRAV